MKPRGERALKARSELVGGDGGKTLGQNGMIARYSGLAAWKSERRKGCLKKKLEERRMESRAEIP